MIAFAHPLCDMLHAVLEEYIDAHDLCVKHRDRLVRHVNRFVTWRASSQLDSDSDAAIVSAWLNSLSPELSPVTRNGYRQSIVTLIRFATPDGAPLPRVDRIRRQREPQKINAAFTSEEIRTLLTTAPDYAPVTHRTYGRGLAGDTIPRHRPDGVPWSVWWRAFTHIGYESGQYLADLSQIPWVDVRADGSVTFVRKKTRKLMSFRLSQQAIQSARTIGHATLLLPWSFDTAAYFAREWRKFCRFAGVRDLGPKSLRRSAITYTYIAQGEEAARILAGHSSFATTAKHYIDWSIAKRPIVSPPPLGETL